MKKHNKPISDDLDADEVPEIDAVTTAAKALAIVRWLRYLSEAGQAVLHVICMECAGVPKLSAKEPPILAVFKDINGL